VRPMAVAQVAYMVGSSALHLAASAPAAGGWRSRRRCSAVSQVRSASGERPGVASGAELGPDNGNWRRDQSSASAAYRSHMPLTAP
jgi:hypothetical protein